MRIYISGGITDIPDYKEKFAKAEEHIKREFNDAEVINPTMIVLPESCTHDDYMLIDFKLLDLADAIFLMNGWEKSRGACMEYGYAYAKDLIILMEREQK